jgi:hypothetical protein
MIISTKSYIVSLSFVLPCGKQVLRQIPVCSPTKKQAREYADFWIDQFTARNSDENEVRLSTSKVIVLHQVNPQAPMFLSMQAAQAQGHYF